MNAIKKKKSNLRKAFTIIEIMVVVALLIILVGLSVPNILRSRVVAYEGGAIANLKTLSNACQLYHVNQGTYPSALTDLSNANPPYIDSFLGSGTKQRYQFVYVRVNADSFTINTNPTSSGLLKGKYFYTDESGVIRSNASVPAGPQDEIVQ